MRPDVRSARGPMVFAGLRNSPSSLKSSLRAIWVTYKSWTSGFREPVDRFLDLRCRERLGLSRQGEREHGRYCLLQVDIQCTLRLLQGLGRQRGQFVRESDGLG